MTQTLLKEETSPIRIEDFEALFLRFQGPLLNFMYQFVSNWETAKDLTQDVFLKAYKSLAKGAVVPPAAFPSWLYRIASNTATDNWRRRKVITWISLTVVDEDRHLHSDLPSEMAGFRRGNAASAMLPPDEVETFRPTKGGYGPSTGATFEATIADREIIERTLERMPEKYSTCLWLYEHDGHSCREIAQTLQISESSVKMRLMRARQQFIDLYCQEVREE